MKEKIILSDDAFTLSNFRESEKGNTLYQFDLKVEKWHLKIKNCSIVNYKDKVFFSFPRKKYTNKEGEEKWTSDIWMDEEEKERLTVAILNLIQSKYKH